MSEGRKGTRNNEEGVGRGNDDEEGLKEGIEKGEVIEGIRVKGGQSIWPKIT